MLNLVLFYVIAIITDSVGSYDSVEHNEEWQSMLQLDCRGLEPIDFDPRVRVCLLVTFLGNYKSSFQNGWTAVGIESGTVFDDIDLSEKVGLLCGSDFSFFHSLLLLKFQWIFPQILLMGN